MHHVVMYSAGGGSWKTATRVAEAHGTADLRLLFTDTLYESADTYRFLILSAAQIYGIALPEGTVPDLADFPAFRDRAAYKAFLVALRERVSPLIPGLAWIADGRDVWDVFRDERFLGNSGVDPCSKILKRQLAAKWLDRNCEKENTRVYVGIDWTEKHRYDDGQGHGVRPRRAADGWEPAEIPLDEPEAYRVAILGADGRPLRESATAEPALLYAAADEIADFGTSQTAITVAVAQVGALAGPGEACRARVPVRMG